MNRFQKFISKFSRKSQTISLRATRNTGNYTYFIDGLDYRYNERSFSEFVQNGYSNPYMYSVVEKIADIASTLPRSLKDETGAKYPKTFTSIGGRELAAILKNPNSQDSCEEFYHKIFTSLLVTGNAIIFADIPVGMSKFGQLRVARTADVTIETVNGYQWSDPKTYHISEFGEYEPGHILHIRLPNIIENSHWGLSPLYAGRAVYTASNNTFEAKAHILDNRGVSGILSAKDANVPMMPRDQEKLQKEFNKRTAGADKVGGIHITTAAMQYLDVGMSSKDLELIGHNIESLRDVCRIYGVDSSLFNDPANRTFSNQEQAKKSLLTDVILPVCKKVDNKLGPWILESFGLEKAVWSIDKDEIEILNRPDQELSTKLISEVAAGIITAEEAREKLYPEL